MKERIKHLIGFFRACIFRIKREGSVYIGKGCSLKGKKNIRVSNDVTIRPYVQIWSGGETVRKLE